MARKIIPSREGSSGTCSLPQRVWRQSRVKDARCAEFLEIICKPPDMVKLKSARTGGGSGGAIACFEDNHRSPAKMTAACEASAITVQNIPIPRTRPDSHWFYMKRGSVTA
jgi:hypothetical protein